MASKPIALFYLARGAHPDEITNVGRFSRSYAAHSAGVDHTLYVIVKGFRTRASMDEALSNFRNIPHRVVHTGDDHYDLGAYAEALQSSSEDVACFLNTNSEILDKEWLRKLWVNLSSPLIGAVGATGSYQSLDFRTTKFPPFPNPHLRSNAIMMRQDLADEILSSSPIADKMDAYLLESGPAGITRQIHRRGLAVLVVGRDGRGYGPESWPHSRTYRTGRQENLLVHDKVTRHYEQIVVADKLVDRRRTWGDSPESLLAEGEPRRFG